MRKYVTGIQVSLTVECLSTVVLVSFGTGQLDNFTSGHFSRKLLDTVGA